MSLPDRLDEFGIYSIYMALKLHYGNDSYDAIKYRFKTRVNQQSFWKRKDRYFFYRVGVKFNWRTGDILDFFNAMFATEVIWVGDMLNDEATWNDYQKILQSFNYVYENDINKIHEVCGDFDRIFIIPEGKSHPLVIQMLLEGDISIETIVALNKVLGFVPRLKITETIIWPDLKRRILKYGRMIDEKINPKKVKEITMKVWTS